MRLGARAALVAGNHKEVIDLTDIALDTEVEFPELHAMRGRAADALGDKQTAMRHLEQAAANESAPFSTQLHFARVAFNGGWFGEAIDAYQMVLAHAGADQSARDEAERQLGRLGRARSAAPGKSCRRVIPGRLEAAGSRCAILAADDGSRSRKATHPGRAVRRGAWSGIVQHHRTPGAGRTHSAAGA